MADRRKKNSTDATSVSEGTDLLPGNPGHLEYILDRKGLNHFEKIDYMKDLNGIRQNDDFDPKFEHQELFEQMDREYEQNLKRMRQIESMSAAERERLNKRLVKINLADSLYAAQLNHALATPGIADDIYVQTELSSRMNAAIDDTSMTAEEFEDQFSL